MKLRDPKGREVEATEKAFNSFLRDRGYTEVKAEPKPKKAEPVTPAKSEE